MKYNILLFLHDNLPFDEIPLDQKYYQFVIVREKELNDNFHKPYEIISGLQRTSKSVLWLSIGDKNVWEKYFCEFPCKRWIHRNSFTEWNLLESETYLMNSMLLEKDTQPVISVFTTTFHSGKKIYRPLDSLTKQTFRNWEWIIWDDSKDNKTYDELLEFQKKDIRIHVFKAPQHSGFIGEVKKRGCDLCKGKWLVELDHDDYIAPTLFQKIVEIENKYPDTDFIYSDYAMIKEENGKDTTYGSTFGYGYGSYMNQWSSDGNEERYYTTCINPAINPATVRYIIGVPNHVRIWNKSFYQKISGHNPELPVVDDYELLLRSFLHSSNWVRIPECLYFQFQNSGGNNFTIHRNALIQHLTKWSAKIYEKQIHERFMNLYGNDNKIYFKYTWMENPQFEQPYFGKIYDIHENDLTIVIPVCFNSNLLKLTLESIFKQNVHRWKIYLIGNNCPELGGVIKWIVDNYKEFVSRVDWWNSFEQSQKEHELLNYATKMYITNYNLNRYVIYMKAGMVMSSENFVTEHLEFIKENPEINYYQNKDMITEGIYGTIFKMEVFKSGLFIKT